MELGVDGVEPDIVVSSDGVLVVRHENEISGTTDVADRIEYKDRRTTKTVDGAELTGWFAEDFTWDELSTLRCRERLPKLRHCPVFQWAHQEYASPLALGLGDRMRVLREVEPILRAHGDFFLDHRALLKVLSMPQLPVPAVARAVRWLDFMNEKRGRSLPDDASIRSSSGDGTHV